LGIYSTEAIKGVSNLLAFPFETLVLCFSTHPCSIRKM